jgi:hypothetical protein
MRWTEDMKAQLRNLWANKELTVDDIAREMGFFRNGKPNKHPIAGKAFWLRLPPKKTLGTIPGSRRAIAVSPLMRQSLERRPESVLGRSGIQPARISTSVATPNIRASPIAQRIAS